MLLIKCKLHLTDLDISCIRQYININLEQLISDPTYNEEIKAMLLSL